MQTCLCVLSKEDGQL